MYYHTLIEKYCSSNKIILDIYLTKNVKYRAFYGEYIHKVSLLSSPPFASERKRKKGRKRPPLVNVHYKLF